MKSPLLAKIKFEPTFFQVLWRFVFSLPLFGEAGGKGDSVFALPPAEPVNEIGSDIFKYTPPIGKSSFWLARYAGSPAVPPFQEKGGMNFLSLFREAERQKRAFHYFI